MLTRLGLYAGPRQQYGDFSLKVPDGVKSFSTVFTRLALYSGARPLYGSFENKVPEVVETGIVTRLSLYGVHRPPYGSFVGKIGGGGPIFATMFRLRSPAPQQRYKTSKPQGVYLSA